MISENGKNLVFIIGIPRSGTTMINNVLNNIPNVLSSGESWLMFGIHQFGKVSNVHPANSQLVGQAIADFIDDDEVKQGFRSFVKTIINAKLEKANSTIFVDKTPRYYLIIDFIKSLFPEAKIIFFTRNPFDIAVSYNKTWGINIHDHLEFGHGDEVTFDFLVGFHNLANAMSMPGSLTLKYEDFVTNQRDSIKSLVEYLEFNIDDIDYKALASFSAKNMVVSDMGDKKIFKTNAVHSKSIDVWKNQLPMSHQQIICEMIGKQNIKKLGYEHITIGVKKLSEEQKEYYDKMKTRMLSNFNKRNELINLTSNTKQPIPNYINSNIIEIMKLVQASSKNNDLIETIEMNHAKHVSVVDLVQQGFQDGSYDARLPRSASQRILNNIGVDFSPMLRGHDNGGAKTFCIDLIQALCHQHQDTTFTLFIMPELEEELAKILPENAIFSLLQKSPSKLSLAKRVLFKISANLPKAVSIRLQQFYFNVKVHFNRKPPIEPSTKFDLMFYPFTRPELNYSPNVPCVSVIYDLQHKFFPNNFVDTEIAVRNSTYQLISERCSMSVCISDYTRQKVEELINIAPDKLKTIHIQLSQRLIGHDNSENENPVSHLIKDNYFIYPANFWPHKNHSLLLIGFMMARAQGLDRSLKLILTGSDLGKKEYLQRLIDSFGLTDSVVFVGFLADEIFKDVLINAKFMIYPSFFEGFGMPILEAMSSGVPVLCSDETSIPEVAGEAAVFFNPRKPKDIAEAILKIDKDDLLRNSLIVAGKLNARKFSKTKNMANAYWTIFEDCVENANI